MTHQDLDTDAIAARINREHPGDGGLKHDVSKITGELEYVAGGMNDLQVNLGGVIASLLNIIERLGELQRGSLPDNDHRPLA